MCRALSSENTGSEGEIWVGFIGVAWGHEESDVSNGICYGVWRFLAGSS